MPGAPEPLLCPSAQPDMEGAQVFAVVGGTADAPKAAYLKQSAVVDQAVIAGIGDLKPTQVFRFAARCEEGRCAQFANGCCSLGQRIAERLSPVVADPPSCRIRPGCRWFAERGVTACVRCPQVVTVVPQGEDRLREVALPGA